MQALTLRARLCKARARPSCPPASPGKAGGSCGGQRWPLGVRLSGRGAGSWDPACDRLSTLVKQRLWAPESCPGRPGRVPRRPGALGQRWGVRVKEWSVHLEASTQRRRMGPRQTSKPAGVWGRCGAARTQRSPRG